MSDVIYNISSGFFDSVNGDRLYSAADMNKPYKRVIADGIFPTPQGTPSTDFQVVAVSGMSVAVLAGNAMIGSRWAENTDDVGITIAGNSSSSPRIDSIFLHIDTGMDTRAAGVVYRQGTAAGTPTAPAMVQTDNITELRLADILVAPSAAIITQANITDQRGGSDCPWVAGLIQQVDTSALFDQYRAAYAEQQQDQADEWNTFMDHLARDYDISMSLRKHESTYTSTAAASLIPINIDGYDTTKDLLQVYINGIFAVEGTHYIVKSAAQIQLTNAISAGQKVHFVIYKAVMGGAQPIIPTDEQVQDAVDAYMDAHPGALVVDPELSDTSTHAIQNKAVTEAFAGVNGRLRQLSDFATISKVGTLNASFTGDPKKITSASYSRVVYGLVGAANSVTVKKNAGRVFAVGFTSTNPANGVSLLSWEIDSTAETITAEVPEGAKYVAVSCYNSNLDTGTAEEMINSVVITGNYGAKDATVREYIDAHSTDIKNSAVFMSDMAYKRVRTNLFNGILTQGYTSANGTQYPNSTAYLQTAKIDVHGLVGETIKVWNEGTQRYIRFVCAYSQTELPIEPLGTNTNGLAYTIPEGAYYVVLSFAKTQFVTNDILITTSDDSIYSPPASEWSIDGYDAVTGAVNIPTPVQLSAESLANSQRIVGTANSVKRLASYVLYCKPGELTEDNYIIFGKDSNKGYAVGISSTKLAWFKNDSIIGSLAHGLTIADYLFVTVDKVPGTGAVVNVYTNGGHYSRTNTSWTDDHGAPYVYNNSGETITDVKMTWTSSALRNRNWIFGDSYVSIAATRWPKYVYDLGFGENLMINGYPGEQTTAGYADLIDCLKRGKPSVMAWCLGMNDADSGAINSSWLSHTQAFLSVCQLFDITPILATIPCCPIADHSYKNAWVRESGYRYIDFARAVNATQDSTTWFTGMLSNDNIHPTEQGAVALASQVLTDFPELLIK